MAWVTKRKSASGSIRYQGRYRDPHGEKRTAGTFSTSREALKSAMKAEGKVADGTWIDPRGGAITFREYAEDVWLPSRHLEVSTRAGYSSHLRNHFVPFFGAMPLARIMPSTVQDWVSGAAARACLLYA